MLPMSVTTCSFPLPIMVALHRFMPLSLLLSFQLFFFPIWNQTASEIFPLYCPALTTRKSKFMFFIQSSIPFQFTCLVLIPFFFKATIARDTFVLHSLFTSNQFPGPVHFLLKYLIYLSISFIFSLYQPCLKCSCHLTASQWASHSVSVSCALWPADLFTVTRVIAFSCSGTQNDSPISIPLQAHTYLYTTSYPTIYKMPSLL